MRSTTSATAALIVERSTLSGNTTDGEGGGIYTTSGTVTVSAGSTIAGNQARSGGGIYSAGELTKAGQRGRIDVTQATVSGNAVLESGGGILNDLEGQLTLVDATVSGNRAGFEGGDVRNQSKASLVVTGGTFADNVAGGGGGGVSTASEGDTRIEGVVFSGNAAGQFEDGVGGGGEDGGGGLYADGKGAVTVTGATFAANTASGDGGGVGFHASGDVTFADSVVRDNVSLGAAGGIENGAELVTFTGLTVTGNSATLDGGGINNTSSKEFTLLNSHVEGNSAENGGGFANQSDSTLVVRGSLFLGNTARVGAREDTGLGGGIYSRSDGNSLIENSTVSGNRAQVAGGGIYNNTDGGLWLMNTTVWHNAAPIGGGISLELGGSVNFPIQPNASVILRNTIVGGSLQGGSCEGALSSEGGNLDSGTSCYFQGPGDRDNAKHGLLDLADNGGPTLTHALSSASVAVDQRGVSRPKNITCDSGAYEFEGVPDLPADNASEANLTSLDGQDMTPPDTAITAAPDAATGSTDATIAFSADPDQADATFECALDGGAFEPCGSSVEFSHLGDGAHRLEVRATNAFGLTDETPAGAEWIVEAPPETTLETKSTDPADVTAVTFTFTGSDNATESSELAFECAVDGGEFASCASPSTVEGLSPGTHTFEVRAVDPTPASYEWTVEATP